MIPKRLLFKCEGCGMELRLFAPVERECPDCGKMFVQIDEEDIDLGHQQHPLIASIPWTIEQEVRESMPDIMRGLEELLEEAANDGR